MNHLAGEPSPYLQQHAANPVDWHPWGEMAFARARGEQRPIFLSVGYATCHWCHVMAHESFEDPATAAILNREFVCIKVDREERPDVDRVYMTFVQATTGAGGWPLSVWLTPSLEPFYGGTYFPPAAAYGRPSFTQVLNEIARAWREDRRGIVASAADVVARLRGGVATASSPPARSDAEALDAARAAWARAFDDRRGGFGDGPKFPRPSELAFLLREHVRTGDAHARLMVLATLRGMALGGMRDHVGGGFHRYSVDGGWRVPHFEKMLYDQAQLVLVLLEAAQLSDDPFFAQVAEDTLRYVARDLTAPEGAFYSAEDADSVPQAMADTAGARATEGAFYTWTHDEIAESLGPEARLWALRFGVRPGGNAPFDPHGEFGAGNLLYTAKTIAAIAEETGLPAADVGLALARGRQKLFARRLSRPRPLRDEKILTAWNGLMIAALARAARVLARPGALGDESGPTGATHLAAAQRAATFLQAQLWEPSRGTLLRRVAAGAAGIEGFAEDYACLASGLVELFQADGNPAWLTWARSLIEVLERRFAAPDDGGWFATTGDDPSVLLRQVEDYDAAEPSASAVAVHTLLVLARLTGDTSYRVRAERVMASWSDRLHAQPRGAPFMLAALSTALLPPIECVITGTSDGAGAARLAQVVDARFLPAAVVIPALASPHRLIEAVPWIAPMLPSSGTATAYVCRDFVCERPVHDPAALGALLDELTLTRAPDGSPA